MVSNVAFKRLSIASHIFHVEEHSIKAKEHPTDACCEPAKGRISKGIDVNPDLERTPSFWCTVSVVRVLLEENQASKE